MCRRRRRLTRPHRRQRRRRAGHELQHRAADARARGQRAAQEHEARDEHLQRAHAEGVLGEGLEAVEAQLEAHLEEQKKHSELRETLDALTVVDQPELLQHEPRAEEAEHRRDFGRLAQGDDGDGRREEREDVVGQGDEAGRLAAAAGGGAGGGRRRLGDRSHFGRGGRGPCERPRSPWRQEGCWPRRRRRRWWSERSVRSAASEDAGARHAARSCRQRAAGCVSM